MEYHPSSPPPWLPGWATADPTSVPDHPVEGEPCTMPEIIKDSLKYQSFSHSPIKSVDQIRKNYVDSMIHCITEQAVVVLHKQIVYQGI